MFAQQLRWTQSVTFKRDACDVAWMLNRVPTFTIDAILSAVPLSHIEFLRFPVTLFCYFVSFRVASVTKKEEKIKKKKRKKKHVLFKERVSA